MLKLNEHFTVPVIFLFLLISTFWYELSTTKTTQPNNTMIGEALPAFTLASADHTNKPLLSKDLRGKVSLLNVFASWCVACQAEHPLLMTINKKYHIPIYGILYKDDAKSVLKALKQQGNPYTKIGLDPNGDAAIDLGIYGTPETFIVSPEGKILYRHIGALTEAVWKHQMLPIIKHYQT